MGGGTSGLLAIMQNGENMKSFRTFIRFSAAMFVVPALVMILSYKVLFTSVYPIANPGDRMAAAGIAAACSVQGVIVAFIIYAFREPVGDAATEKKVA